MPHHPPMAFKVMVSSTYTDLIEHRQAVNEHLLKAGLKPEVMEHKVLEPDATIYGNSMDMVEASHGYILIIGRRYGGIVGDKSLNPDELSVTEQEYDRAQALGIPTLVLMMGPKHPVLEQNIELVPNKRKKLEAFRKKVATDGKLHLSFDDLEKLRSELGHLTQKLQTALSTKYSTLPDSSPETTDTPIPTTEI